MKMKGKQKIITTVLIAVLALLAILAGVYSANDNHYALDVVTDKATSRDSNLRITEEILPSKTTNGIKEYDPEELTYEVTVQNINGTAEDKLNREVQVALVVDTSYSMESNDELSILKQTAIDLASSIFDNVPGVRMSLFTNAGRRKALTTNKADIIGSSGIPAITMGETQDCNYGLEQAHSNGFGSPANGKTASRTIIYITDSTDNVSAKMQQIQNQDTDLEIISVLVDMTSSAYIDYATGNPTGARQKVYVIPSNVQETDILPENVEIYSEQKVYEELNLAVNNVKVSNIFSDAILSYFDVEEIDPLTYPTQGTITFTTDSNGKINGYEWNVGSLKFSQSEKIRFKLKYNQNITVAARDLFWPLYTNKEQNVTYNMYNSNVQNTLQGTDERVSDTAGSTVLQICKGYTLKIKAVNDTNRELEVEGLEIRVVGVDFNTGEKICDITKTTDAYGYITITSDETKALRRAGEIDFTLTAENSNDLTGYSTTSPVTFPIINNYENTTLLEFPYEESFMPDPNINERNRVVEVEMPIESVKVAFEIRAQELNDNTKTLSDCEFELIQPKLNSKYEMSVLSGKTDENGVLTLNPTVMTKDGTYNYILRQVSAPSDYDITAITLIKITFENGRIVAANSTTGEITTMYNENVTAILDENSATSSNDHVIVTVGDQCVAVDPFPFQINLSDIDDSDIKLEGVTYLVETTNSIGEVRKQYATTDENGQINLDVFGTGNMKIKITEDSPKVGYQRVSDPKELIINRSNGSIWILNMYPSNIANTKEYNSEFISDDDGNPIGLIVNLASKKKAEQNVIGLKIVYADEQDTPVGAGIAYELFDENGISYGQEVTNNKGEISFTIGNETEGTHIYHLVPDLSLIPSEFDVSYIDTNIDVQIDFDAAGYIKDGGNNAAISAPTSLIEEKFKRITNEDKIEYTYELVLGYYVQLGNTFRFNVNLTDENTNQGIQGAKYDINISWNVVENGQTITRTKNIVGRQTNDAGNISTTIVKADDVYITVTEKEPKVGYNLDTTTQEIHLSKHNNNTMYIAEQVPYDLGQTNTKKPKCGTEAKPDIWVNGEYTGGVTYYHQNKARTAEDTYINLTVHKIDMNGTSVNGKLVKVSSPKLVDENDEELKTVISTGSQNPSAVGEVIFDYNDFINGVDDSHLIRVPGLNALTGEDQSLTYEMDIVEVGKDPVNEGEYIEKDETRVRLRLTFENKNNTIRLMDVYPIYGNYLVKEKTVVSGSDSAQGRAEQDSLGVYYENVGLTIYTDYDNFGNLSLDLMKQDTEERKLEGAAYDIMVANPDGTQYRFQKVKVKNGEMSDDIELKGVTVYKDSLIYIQEIEAPTGYALNESAETLLVTDIDSVGNITFEHINNNYDPERLELVENLDTTTSTGNIKKNYTVKLTDMQVDRFKIQANVKDDQTSEIVSDFTFKVNTSVGAFGKLSSGVESQIGGNPINTTVTYTLTPENTAKFYRKIDQTIKVNVVFDGAGSVDTVATMAAQTDSNYGTLWEITNIKGTDVGDLVLDIKASHLDPLTVKVDTYDIITNSTISQVDYKVTPSEVLPATGSNSISVGYVVEKDLIAYTLEQTNIKDTYNKASNVNFSLQYVDTKIDSVVSCSADASHEKAPTAIKTGDREVTISVYVQPKTVFEVTNKEFFGNNDPLQGANFEITEVQNSEISTGQTDANGKAVVYISKFEADTSKIYKVRQTLAKAGFATVEDFYIKVDYDTDKVITATTLVDEYGVEVTNNRFVNVGFRIGSTSEYNGNQKGIVTIEVKNYPEFRFNITDVDRRDGQTPLVGTTYSVTSSYVNSQSQTINFTSTNNVITNDAGLGVAHLDKTKENTIVTYIIKEDIPAIGYQSIGKDIAVRVTFDQNGYVTNAELADDQLSNIATVSMIEPITTDSEKFQVNVELKNNPLLKINLITTDRTDNTIKLKDVGYEIIGREGTEEDAAVVSNSSNINSANKTGTPQTSYSNDEGLATAYMDRTLENKTIAYSIKEVKKAVGYDWLDDDVILNVTYTSDGKMSAIPTIAQGNTDCSIISWDAENFEINMYIYNDEVKEFGIHLSVTDVNDSDKKIDNLKVDAFLTDIHDNSCSVPDSSGNYEFRAVNEETDGIKAEKGALLTGADRNGDGLPDLTHGEDYKVMGQYTTNNSASTEVRYLRMYIRNDASSNSVNGYYLDSFGTDDGNNIGHYKGSKYFGDALYQNVIYNWMVRLTFNDEGKVIAAEQVTGLNPTFGGWFTDDRYLEIGKIPENGTYKLELKMKLYPMLDLSVLGMDNYTKQEISGGQYLISTKRYNLAGMKPDEFVKAGYIGYGEGGLEGGGLYPGHAYEGTNTMYMPIGVEEDGNERLIYVYEMVEPTNYQQHRPQYLVHQIERLVAIIRVKFNDLGEIEYENSIERKTLIGIANDTEPLGYSTEEHTVEPYWNENVISDFEKFDYNLLTADNIKKYNYDSSHKDDGANRDLSFSIGHGLSTKINMTAVDDISYDPITNIKVYPLINNEEKSQIPEANEMHLADRFYEYDTIGYRTTASNGKSSWAYWGAAEKTDINRYIIKTQRSGNEYQGYLFPADMANASMGGSGNESDYYIKLDVTYDENGRISDVTSLGRDLWGDDNVADITWDSETGTININALHSRKLLTSIYKTDFYDSTINDLLATFNVRSNKGLNTEIKSNIRNKVVATPFGKVYKDATVKYTLSETVTPTNYFPVTEPIDIYVTFDSNGNVTANKVVSDSEYFGQVSTSKTTQVANKQNPDITIDIKNKPAFILDLRVIDKFYKKEGISDIYLDITDSKGGKAAGNPQTDKNGYVKVLASPVYPDETVTYYIKQINTADDYQKNNQTVELTVKFSSEGKIENYSISEASAQIVNNFDSQKHMTTRKIDMDIMNTPLNVKLGIFKYDETTLQAMGPVKFEVTRKDMVSGAETTTEMTTQTNGNIVGIIDKFNEAAGKTIKYTIHEVRTPVVDSYRIMEDVAFVISYENDGRISGCTEEVNDNGNMNGKPELAVNDKLKKFDNQKVHLVQSISNDNAFDIVIKNEDENYQGLGVEGSIFNVNVNVDSTVQNYSYTTASTNSNGITEIKDLTMNGDITITIDQLSAGEGYRDDLDNNAVIKITKDPSVYKIDLRDDQDGLQTDENGDPDTKHAIKVITDNNGDQKTIADIKVDENQGKIFVTFTNVTKNELTIAKQDAESFAGLKGAKFVITAQKVDSITDDPILDEDSNPIIKTITSEGHDTTDDNGKLYFDLGLAPQGEKWIYTLTETETPEGYPDIESTFKFSAVYNQYGRITKLLGLTSKISPVTENENINCRHIVASVFNGTTSPSYKLKVITKDSNTGRYINDSSIQIEIKDPETDTLIPITPSTAGSATNGSTSVTGNISIDGQKYTDLQAYGDSANQIPGNGAIIVGRGTTYIDNIRHNGDLEIAINQTGFANGYTPSDNTQGIIKAKATLGFDEYGEPTVTFTDRDEDKFTGNVDWNEKTRTITVTIYNNSEVTLNTQTIAYGLSTIVPIPDVSYKVTSEISTIGRLDATELDVTTPASDHDEGKSVAKIGNSYAGQTVIYTLSQYENAPIGTTYQPLPEDIKIEVQYDLNGNIKRTELLSSEQYANIETKTQGKEIYVTIRNPLNVLKYQVQIWSHDDDTEYDPDGFGRLLPNVAYKVLIHQEDAVSPEREYIEYVGRTDSDGVLIVPELLNGFGFITISIEQMDAPAGYLLDNTVRQVRVYRNEDGTINDETSYGVFRTIIDAEDDEYEVGQPAKIILHPQLKQIDGQYTLIVNKVSAETGKLITDSSATFNVMMERYDDEGNLVYQEDVGARNYTTDSTGKIRESGIPFPQEEGIYKFILTETEAPYGYARIEEPIVINLKLILNNEGNILIDEAWTDVENVEVQGKNQVLFIKVGNELGDIIAENEYGLDITKVDAVTGEPIEDMAIFKVWLPDTQNTAVYTETSQTLRGPGKLDYCYIEENKDYRLRLTHLIQPTEAGTYQFVFKEVVAPTGYALIPEDLVLTLTFEYDEENNLCITDATSSNEDYLEIVTDTSSPVSLTDLFKINILNYEGSSDEPITPPMPSGEYLIKYNGNANGENITIPLSQVKKAGVDLILDPMVPVRDGYVFKGWATSKNATTPDYMPSDTYTKDEHTTLYAVWEKEEHLEISSTEYLIGIGTETAEDWTPGDLSKYEEGDLYIKGIRPQAGRDRRGKQPQNPGTSLDEFLSKITTNAETVTVYIPEIDSNGDKVLKEENIVANDSLVATGMIAKFVRGEEEVTITLIVRGDFVETGKTTGDGKLALTDYTKASQLTRRNLNTILSTDEDRQAFDYYVDSTKAWLENRQAIISSYTSKTLENMR